MRYFNSILFKLPNIATATSGLEVFCWNHIFKNVLHKTHLDTFIYIKPFEIIWRACKHCRKNAHTIICNFFCFLLRFLLHFHSLFGYKRPLTPFSFFQFTMFNKKYTLSPLDVLFGFVICRNSMWHVYRNTYIHKCKYTTYNSSREIERDPIELRRYSYDIQITIFAFAFVVVTFFPLYAQATHQPLFPSSAWWFHCVRNRKFCVALWCAYVSRSNKNSILRSTPPIHKSGHTAKFVINIVFFKKNRKNERRNRNFFNVVHVPHHGWL